MEEYKTYNQLKISTFELAYIKTLGVENKINEHGILKLKGMLSDNKKEEDIHTKTNTPIELYYMDKEERKTIYWGIITQISIKAQGEYYEIEIEAQSYTYMMDIEKKCRSFQDKTQTIHSLIKAITKEYEQSDCILYIPDEPIERLWIQYEETDWEFIKRIASYYHVGVFPEITLRGVKYFLNTPQITEKDIEVHEYTVTKKINEYEMMKENHVDSLNEIDYICYEVKSPNVLKLGAHFTFNGHNFYISHTRYKLSGSLLENTYYIQLKQGQQQVRIWHESLKGVSLEGKVIDVKGTHIKIKLDIDKNQDKEKAYWFNYSTLAASPDGSGWYFMPELGDRVRLHFPTVDEVDAFGISSIREVEGNPDVKYIATIYGKEIVFTKDSITLSANDNAKITLGKDGSISISGSSISINAGESISLRAEDSIILSGKNNVDISCDKGGKALLVDNGEIMLKGTKVRVN